MLLILLSFGLDRQVPELPPTIFAGIGLRGLEFEGLATDACPVGTGVIDTERGDEGNTLIDDPAVKPGCGGVPGGRRPGEPKEPAFLDECKGCDETMREPGLLIGGLDPSSHESFRRGEFDGNGEGSTRSYPISPAEGCAADEA